MQTLMLLLAFAPALFAQTVTAKAVWTTTDSVTVAQGYTYTLQIGTTVVPMGAVTCTSAGTPPVTSCSAPLTPPLAAGSYTLTASNGFGSATSDPFVGVIPGKPGFSITVIITFS